MADTIVLVQSPIQQLVITSPGPQGPSGGGGGSDPTKLAILSNLSDLNSASIARTNLGLGTAATQNTGAFDTAGLAVAVQTNLNTHTGNVSNPHSTTAVQAGALAILSNLSDLNLASAARTNLGLGTAATQNTGAFDAAGAATAVQTALRKMIVNSAGTIVVSQMTGVTGAGTSGSPYVGWDSLIGTGTAFTAYYFDPGAYFQFSSTLLIRVSNMALIGGKGTILKYTGTGKAISIDARIQPLLDLEHNVISDIIIDGNGTADVGLYVDCCHRSVFSDIHVRNMKNTGTTSTAFKFLFTVCSEMTRLSCSVYVDSTGTMPYYGLVLGDLAAAWNAGTAYIVGDLVRVAGIDYYRLIAGTTATTPASDPTNWRSDGTANPPCVCVPAIYSPLFEGMRGDGIYGKYVFQAYSFAGSSESNTGAGLRTTSLCYENNWLNNFESNTGGVFVDGKRELLLNSSSIGSTLTFGANSRSCKAELGSFNDGMTDNGARNSVIRVQNLTLAALTGTAVDTIFIEESTGLIRQPTISYTAPSTAMTLRSTTAAGGQATLDFKSDRTSHVQDWQVGIGIQDFNAFCIFDTTGSTIPFEIKEGGAGIFMVTAPVTTGTITTGVGSVVGTGDRQLLVNSSNANGAALRLLSTGNRDSYHVQTASASYIVDNVVLANFNDATVAAAATVRFLNKTMNVYGPLTATNTITTQGTGNQSNLISSTDGLGNTFGRYYVTGIASGFVGMTLNNKFCIGNDGGNVVANSTAATIESYAAMIVDSANKVSFTKDVTTGTNALTTGKMTNSGDVYIKGSTTSVGGQNPFYVVDSAANPLFGINSSSPTNNTFQMGSGQYSAFQLFGTNLRLANNNDLTVSVGSPISVNVGMTAVGSVVLNGLDTSSVNPLVATKLYSGF